MEPLRFIEPVLDAFVTSNSCIDGPPEPEMAIKTLPSVVFKANSPNSRFEFVGF